MSHRRRSLQRGVRRAVATIGAALAIVLGVSAPPVGAAPAQLAPGRTTRATAPCPTMFTAAFVTDLERRHPGVAVTAAVYDTASGCWHHIHQGRVLTTASVIKAQVLGAVLLKAQREGRGLTSWERSQIDPMIRLSHNPETSALIAHVGGSGGMEASDAAFGATATTHPSTFGLTASTAVDRTRVALALLHGGGALAQAGRDVAWTYLSTVHPLQEWGISAGVPHGWSVAQKDGFYPASGRGWRVGSTGFVRREDADQGYAITVMTEGGGDQGANVAMVEEVARRAASVLAVGPGAARPVDRARCTRTAAGETWATVAARLGLPTSRAAEVRSVAGGNASPLSGQRACSPDIPPEPRAATSTVAGRYRPVVADLSCDGADDLLWYAPGTSADVRWQGRASRRFSESAIVVDGDYLPIAGDFDGDGCGDVLWYGPGARADTVWYGGRSITSRWVPVDTPGSVPRSGDFDGDGRTDVLWYVPGPGRDVVWFGGGRGAFASVEVSVSGAYVPVVGDLDGDGADDVVWYGPGSASDAFWRGRPGVRRFAVASMVAVSGRYRPVAFDPDGDGTDELLWYAPGPAADVRWQGSPAAPRQVAASVRGDYLPMVGDLDGDGHDDVAWYGPGGGPEVAWWGGPGSIASGPLAR